MAKTSENMNSITSIVYINSDGDIVKKLNSKYDGPEFTLLERELHVLDLLSEFDWCPKVLSVNEKDRLFFMTMMGSPISKSNIPSDAEDQLQGILDDLKSKNIRHNDIKKEEILVDKNGKMALCDFGWASLGDDFSFGLENISSREKPNKIFDDANSFDILKKIRNES